MFVVLRDGVDLTPYAVEGSRFSNSPLDGCPIFASPRSRAHYMRLNEMG